MANPQPIQHLATSVPYCRVGGDSVGRKLSGAPVDVSPTRLGLAPDRLAAAALGAAVSGLFDAANVGLGTRLWFSASDYALVALASVLQAGTLGLVAGVALCFLPGRPRGRSRWLAFLVGMAAWWLLFAAVYVLTDPPPFTEPARFQGQPLALVGAGAVLSVLVLALYQGVRGARNVSVAATILVLAHGIVSWRSMSPGGAASGASAAVAPATGASPVGSGGGGRTVPVPPAKLPNILLVTLDTTRADHMGAYGNREVATPHLDALAFSGVRWTNASAVAAVTGPSHSAMFSGSPPWHSGVLLNGVPLPGDQVLLAERLSGLGYDTAGFTSAYVLDGKLGFSRGFDVYDDEFSWLRGGSLLLPSKAVAMWSRRADPDAVLERRGSDTVDLALNWLANRGERPWFLWVHLFDAHGPYTPPPPFDTRYYSGDQRDPGHTSMRQVTGVAPYLEASLKGVTDLEYVLAQYAGEISYADAQLGRLVDGIVAKDTLVSVIADHGESLGEHDVWFNHGDDLYESSLHVPFVMSWAGQLPPSVLTAPVQGTDLATTILARLGQPGIGSDSVDALAAERVDAGAMCFDRATNLAERAAGRVTKPTYRLASLRGGSSRYVQREIDSRDEYFDLDASPGGLIESVATFSATEVGVSLLPMLRTRTDAMFGGDTSRSAVDVSEEERLKLEMLGYLDQ